MPEKVSVPLGQSLFEMLHDLLLEKFLVKRLMSVLFPFASCLSFFRSDVRPFSVHVSSFGAILDAESLHNDITTFKAITGAKQ